MRSKRKSRGRRKAAGEILVTTFVTIDGVMQANGSLEHGWAEGFEHGGWQAPYTDAEVHDLITQYTLQADAFLFGL